VYESAIDRLRRVGIDEVSQAGVESVGSNDDPATGRDRAVREYEMATLVEPGEALAGDDTHTALLRDLTERRHEPGAAHREARRVEVVRSAPRNVAEELAAPTPDLQFRNQKALRYDGIEAADRLQGAKAVRGNREKGSRLVVGPLPGLIDG
jgi:hypothetical protein